MKTNRLSRIADCKTVLCAGVCAVYALFPGFAPTALGGGFSITSFSATNMDTPDGGQAEGQRRVENLKNVGEVAGAVISAVSPGGATSEIITKAAVAASAPSGPEGDKARAQVAAEIPQMIGKNAGIETVKGVNSTVGNVVDVGEKIYSVGDAVNNVVQGPKSPAQPADAPSAANNTTRTTTSTSQLPPPPPADSRADLTSRDTLTTAMVLALYAGVELEELNPSQLTALLQVAAAINRTDSRQPGDRSGLRPVGLPGSDGAPIRPTDLRPQTPTSPDCRGNCPPPRPPPPPAGCRGPCR